MRDEPATLLCVRADEKDILVVTSFRRVTFVILRILHFDFGVTASHHSGGEGVGVGRHDWGQRQRNALTAKRLHEYKYS